MARTLDIEPVDATLGAVVRGVTLASLDDATWRALHAAWLEYALLIFPDQHLTRPQQIAFAKRFGDLELEMVDVSNVRPDGTMRTDEQDRDFMGLLRGNLDWHTDSSFKPLHAKGAVFCAEVVPPEGGQTGWADMRAAYDALDEAMRKKVEGLSAYHSIYHSQAKLGHQLNAGPTTTLDQQKKDGLYGPNEGPPPLRGLVKVHPETGRRSLLLGRHAYNVAGMAPEESECFLKELMEFACRPPRIYYHDWTPGDAVVWDNRCLLHRVEPWDMSVPRIMWHTRIAGDPLSEAALAH